MAKKHRKSGSFSAKVSADTQKQIQESKKGPNYLLLPKGVEIYKEKPGKALIDFVPYTVSDPNHPDKNSDIDLATKGSLWYKRPFKIHKNIGPENQTVVCPTSIGARCPICEYRNGLISQEGGWDEHKDEISTYRPSDRNLYVVIPLDSKDYDEVPHIWNISQYLFQQQLNEEISENEEYGDFPDLENGYTLRIRFTEKEFKKMKFAEISRIDFEKRDPYSEDDEILENVPDLDKVLIVHSYEELESIFYGQQEDNEDEPLRRRKSRSRHEDEDEDEDEPPRRRKNRSRDEDEDEPPRRRKNQEQYDDEDEPPRRRKNQEQYDDEDEPPRRRNNRDSKTKSRHSRSSMDDDEDEESDIPAPTVKRKRTRTSKQSSSLRDEWKDADRRFTCGSCQGTGFIESGEICPCCKGRGFYFESEIEERGRKFTEKMNPPKAKNQCPHNHTFAHDCDSYKECDFCDIWEQCLDAKTER